MNTKLVAVQEAFQAMLAGKNILVRSTESTLLTDFRPVSEFAADIWAKAGVEFTFLPRVMCNQLEKQSVTYRLAKKHVPRRWNPYGFFHVFRTVG